MSLSTRIAPHLPYLRRYARAATGSQAAGDAYVAATLEALIEDISLFPSASNDRISLYKLFCSLFDKLEVDRANLTSPFAWEQRAAANLSLIAPAPRQAFLLVSVEGFSSGEAAEIMSVDPGAFAKLLASASEEISRQVATDIMIIEDEPLIAMDIEDMVTSLGHRVTGIARTHREAIDIYRQTSPKMVLADIQLADGSSGIDAVNDILTQAAVPVIFITAFPERLLTGNKPEPAFLVTKPFNPEMVKALISQALFFDDQAHARGR
ncbi:response regulator [Sinorhizobium americanum]|uniref:Phyllosphere-induced regulator PhyR n=1 Tax=Sinorhizobium americanum TaxID=194963 RepID=A0A1L3LJ67_9HYPH|nr:response regulator [Sinorhizobium americanum]APG90095.1 phyllosphere-induced regulator PhyR [Sinorhizobium americanum]OAP48504.1 two-component response regulator [Sinorhizobium americanum]